MLVSLGWMLLTGLPFPASSPIANPSAVHPARPAVPRVSVWTDREEPYRRGDAVRVYLAADEPAHLAVFRVDTDGRIRVLFPREPWGDTFVRDPRTFEVSGPRGDRSFLVDDYPGVGYLFAIASAGPFDLRDITRGDYWDYRLMDGGRLRGDPYVQLTELAERLTGGAEHHYDIVPYYVDRHYEYPRFVCYDCHAYASYEQWDPYERACSRFRVVVYDDPAHYPYRENRGRNVVAPRSLTGPRFVFRDADPGRDFVTREQPRKDQRGRTSEDVGGRGSVPAPALPTLGRRAADRGAVESSPPRPMVEERRRPAAERRRDAEPDAVPEGLRPSDREPRVAPERRSRPPTSTGEPELRRRRP